MATRPQNNYHWVIAVDPGMTNLGIVVAEFQTLPTFDCRVIYSDTIDLFDRTGGYMNTKRNKKSKFLDLLTTRTCNSIDTMLFITGLDSFTSLNADDFNAALGDVTREQTSITLILERQMDSVGCQHLKQQSGIIVGYLTAKFRNFMHVYEYRMLDVLKRLDITKPRTTRSNSYDPRKEHIKKYFANLDTTTTTTASSNNNCCFNIMNKLTRQYKAARDDPHQRDCMLYIQFYVTHTDQLSKTHIPWRPSQEFKEAFYDYESVTKIHNLIDDLVLSDQEEQEKEQKNNSTTVVI